MSSIKGGICEHRPLSDNLILKTINSGTRGPYRSAITKTQLKTSAPTAEANKQDRGRSRLNSDSCSLNHVNADQLSFH